MLSKCIVAAALFTTAIVCFAAGDHGYLEGHLSILPAREVELADAENVPTPAADYAQYPLVVLSRDGKREIAKVVVEANGNYRAELPPGDYMLDVQDRGRTHLRARPQLFTVVPNQTVHIDMHIDAGVR